MTNAERISRTLTRRQRATIAWIIYNWPYPYPRYMMKDDVQGLVAMGLFEPFTDDEWGDATKLGREVWKYARHTWKKESDWKPLTYETEDDR